jgi:hypothetical protein
MTEKEGGYNGAYKIASNYPKFQQVLRNSKKRIYKKILERTFGSHAVDGLEDKHKAFFCIE